MPEESQPPLIPGLGFSSLVRSRSDILLVVAAGGALGSLGRWGVGHLLPWTVDRFPWATFLENVSGAFALGILMVLLLDLWPPNRYARPFLGVGVLGGYTTFSTYALEIRDLLAAGRRHRHDLPVRVPRSRPASGLAGHGSDAFRRSFPRRGTDGAAG